MLDCQGRNRHESSPRIRVGGSTMASSCLPRLHHRSSAFRPRGRRAMEMHRAVAACLKAAMERLGTREIVDLCSGGGGPLLAVQRCLASEMGFPTKVTLTDLYPNLSAFKRIEAEGNGAVRCLSQSVSVFEVPEELRGIRTLFTAPHHFPYRGS